MSYRRALGLFATGLAVVTTRLADGTRLGMTVSSFNAVSLSPPLVLFSIGEVNASFAAWRATENFAVHILAEAQEALSSRFARGGTEKWAGLPDTGWPVTGAPSLEGSLAALECRTHARYPGGDHLILVGEVVAIHHHPRLVPRPLVFFASRYRHLAEQAGAEAPEGIAWPQGW